eukprot:scaffold39330_cov41-Prasinocladus_malaysianus.AAC.1
MSTSTRTSTSFSEDKGKYGRSGAAGDAQDAACNGDYPANCTNTLRACRSWFESYSRTSTSSDRRYESEGTRGYSYKGHDDMTGARAFITS